MKELQAVNQNVILKMDKEAGERKTASGIIIPGTVAEEKPKFGTVVSLSHIEGPEIAAGDTVIFKDYSGTEIALDGESFLIVPYADILAKVVETEAI
ncbi:MAG: co-chaperone GroES [Cyclobacteriaceae bacterium]|nr:co-chaperone GroES [Cyclobacteriaceae bacterium]